MEMVREGVKLDDPSSYENEDWGSSNAKRTEFRFSISHRTSHGRSSGTGMSSGTRRPIRRCWACYAFDGVDAGLHPCGLGPGLDDFFGPKSWLSPGLVRAIESGSTCTRSGSRSRHMDVAGVCAVDGVFVCFTLGVWTRITSVLALFTAISYDQPRPRCAVRARSDQHHADLVPGDRTQRQAPVARPMAARRGGSLTTPRPRHPVPANMAQRLIQVHMCVIYLFAGISKLQGPSWWSGEAMWRAFANLEYQSLDMTWLAWHPWLVNLMSHVSVVWEIAFCVLIWKPLWRPLMLAVAVVLHVGIGRAWGCGHSA